MLLWYSCVYNIAVFSSWFFLFSFLFMFSLYLTDSYLSIIYLFVVYVGYGFFSSVHILFDISIHYSILFVLLVQPHVTVCTLYSVQ